MCLKPAYTSFIFDVLFLLISEIIFIVFHLFFLLWQSSTTRLKIMENLRTKMKRENKGEESIKWYFYVKPRNTYTRWLP